MTRIMSPDPIETPVVTPTTPTPDRATPPPVEAPSLPLPTPASDSPSASQAAWVDPAGQYYLGLSRQIASLSGTRAGANVAVGVTSANRHEGVTSVAVNVAAAASRDLQGRVLLVDANFDHPLAAEVAGASDGPGLADLLVGAEEWASLVRRSSMPGLDVLAAGTKQARALLSAGSDRLRGLLREICTKYQMVVFDLPPASELSACLPMANCLDGVLMVVEAERTRNKTVERARQRLTQSGAKLIGAVLNKRREYVPDWIYERI